MGFSISSNVAVFKTGDNRIESERKWDFNLVYYYFIDFQEKQEYYNE